MLDKDSTPAQQFETKYFVDFYDDYRRSVEDLFLSETFFLDSFCSSAEKVLDVGCAVGGMYEILMSINKHINYEGVDISKNMIDRARINYPKLPFSVVNAVDMKYEDESFDSVVSFGTTVHEKNWRGLIRELWRVTSNQVLIDIRLTPDKPTISDVNTGFVLDGSDMPYPYVVVNALEFINFVKNDLGGQKSLKLYGYWGKANEFTTLPKSYSKICMAGALLRKENTAESNNVELNIPFQL